MKAALLKVAFSLLAISVYEITLSEQKTEKSTETLSEPELHNDEKKASFRDWGKREKGLAALNDRHGSDESEVKRASFRDWGKRMNGMENEMPGGGVVDGKRASFRDWGKRMNGISHQVGEMSGDFAEPKRASFRDWGKRHSYSDDKRASFRDWGKREEPSWYKALGHGTNRWSSPVQGRVDEAKRGRFRDWGK